MNKNNKRIGVFGAGAVGSYIGGLLSKADYNITLIDPWDAHVKQIQQHGLRIVGPDGDFVQAANALHLSDAQSITDPFDIIFLSALLSDIIYACYT